MRTIGVKDLKAQLSAYLRAVRAGETILVTHRSEVVAELRPPRKPSRDSPEERLRQLAERGEVTRARRPKGEWEWKVEGLGLEAGTAAALLNELREERGES
ncbi:MAG TPA: type II toxin-antitoxin system prevent-host-death family antitoxin [Longimicrobiaceae bacterium]|nr:type II toxin-antitoxin system prevent-host-death family antitoxin [Longimicrobiaceae bacterium]